MAQTDVPMPQVLPGIQIKLPEPKAFYGENKQARAWLSAVRRYFAAAGLEEEEQRQSVRMCNICSALMQGNAARWLDRLEMLNEMPVNFTEFSQAFKDQYFPLDDQNTARDKLRSVRQKGGVADYCAEFDAIVLALPESHQDDLIHAFIYGLKPNLRPLVKAQIAQKEAPGLADAMTIAVQLDDFVRDTQPPQYNQQRQGLPRIQPSPSWKPRPPRKFQQQYLPLRTPNYPQGRQNGPVPMDLDSMGTRKFQGNCYNCGKIGHRAFECRNKGKQQQQGQQWTRPTPLGQIAVGQQQVQQEKFPKIAEMQMQPADDLKLQEN